jgi:hypothetical protein
MTGKSYFLLGSPFKLACASLFQRRPPWNLRQATGSSLFAVISQARSRR